MDSQTKYITSDIKLASYYEKFKKTEVLFDEHILVWFISGETKIVHANTAYTFNPGDIFLIPRNQLISVALFPKDDLPHKSVAMHLTTSRLKEFYANIDVTVSTIPSPQIPSYHHHHLLDSFLASLLPYFDMGGKFPDNIASLKITEAISILRVIDNSIDTHLANFEQPGKIDLASYMEK